MEKAADFFYL